MSVPSPHCRAALNDLRDLQPFLTSLDVAPAPNYLTRRIMTEVYEQKRGKKSGLTWFWQEALGQPTWVVKGVTTAALIAGLTMGTYMGWSSFPAGRFQPAQTSSMALYGGTTTLYAFDAMSASPDGSLEAAMLKLVEENR